MSQTTERTIGIIVILFALLAMTKHPCEQPDGSIAAVCRE